MGIFVAQLLKWTQPRDHADHPPPGHPRSHLVPTRTTLLVALRCAIYAVATFAIMAQLVTGAATLIDAVYAHNGHSQVYNDLGSLQHALAEADQLAQQHHLNRVYITTDFSSQTAIHYLSEQMHTPTMLFDDSRCLVLPNPSDGPAVLLVSPYAHLTQALLNNYATATLVDRPARLGAPPFRLYIVTPKPLARQLPVSQTFVDNLQMLSLQRQQLNATGHSWLVSRWTFLRSAQPGPRTTYNYAMIALINANDSYSRRSLCTLTSIRLGDQLCVAFPPVGDSSTSNLVTISGQSYTTAPYNPSFGPLHLETDQTQDSPRIVLRTREGKDKMTVPLS